MFYHPERYTYEAIRILYGTIVLVTYPIRYRYFLLDRGSRVVDLGVVLDQLQHALQAVGDSYPVRRGDQKPWKSENIKKK